MNVNLNMNDFDIADAHDMSYPGVIEAIVTLAAETVHAGRCVIIRNGFGIPVRVLNTADDVAVWRDELAA